jgi:hypothetical protein
VYIDLFAEQENSHKCTAQAPAKIYARDGVPASHLNRLASFESWLVKPSVCIFVNQSQCMGPSVTTICTSVSIPPEIGYKLLIGAFARPIAILRLRTVLLA